MYRVIVIDNNPDVTNFIVKELQENLHFEVHGTYTDPYEGLFMVARIIPDILFINIEMYELTGLNIVRVLKERSPQTHIIILADNKEFALESFELQVFDFIVKPITWQRFNKTIKRLKNDKLLPFHKPRFMICCFQQLRFMELNEKRELVDIRWRTKKSKEVFAYLLHHRNKKVRKDELTRIHWAKLNEKDSYAQLYTAVYHIRQVMNRFKIPLEIMNSSTSYQLKINDNNIVIDVVRFRKHIESGLLVNENTIKTHNEYLKLYKGDYFGVEKYEWAVNEQNRLQFLYVNYVKKIANYNLSVGNYNGAILLFSELLKKLLYQEENYFTIMKIYYEIGDIDKIKLYFNKLSLALREVNKRPNDEIEAWYDSKINI